MLMPRFQLESLASGKPIPISRALCDHPNPTRFPADCRRQMNPVHERSSSHLQASGLVTILQILDWGHDTSHERTVAREDFAPGRQCRALVLGSVRASKLVFSRYAL